MCERKASHTSATLPNEIPFKLEVFCQLDDIDIYGEVPTKSLHVGRVVVPAFSESSAMLLISGPDFASRFHLF